MKKDLSQDFDLRLTSNQQLIEIRDAAYEFLGAADDFFGFDFTTPQFLYDNTGGEPSASSQELWMTDFNKKRS
jgi:hypothetical protein